PLPEMPPVMARPLFAAGVLPAPVLRQKITASALPTSIGALMTLPAEVFMMAPLLIVKVLPDKVEAPVLELVGEPRRRALMVLAAPMASLTVNRTLSVAAAAATDWAYSVVSFRG